MLTGVVSSNRFARQLVWICMCFALFVCLPQALYSQADQGAITGTVIDTQGGIVQNATVTITNLDTQFHLMRTTDASGVYVFTPIKIGRYKVSASAPGFATAVRESVQVDVDQRVGVNLTLKAGTVNETVTVNATTPQLQTEEGSTGQVFTTQVINDIPLDGRNWVYVAQLAAGVSIPNGAQGAFGAAQMLNGSGDFTANGQRIWQNNFILDGVDNNSNLQDFLNGATYVMRPPPDALSEFKVQTSDYSAELGHSAGAVVNASIKSGTNSYHGSLWEYFRNNDLDATDYQFSPGGYQTPYHQNQFGATFGGPILKNKLFFFVDAEATRIVYYEPPSLNNTVPTAKMRNGDFSEMLNPALDGGVEGSSSCTSANQASPTSECYPVYLFQTGGQALTAPLSDGGVPVNPAAQSSYYLGCNGQVNVLCGPFPTAATNILNAFPMPNAGVPGQWFNNYNVPPLRVTDNPMHYDTRLDWNANQSDQAFVRYSYSNRPQFFTPPFGTPLDGGGFGTSGNDENQSRNFVLSETHVFSPTLSNEFRFGYNWIRAGFLQVNNETNESASLGLGGIPFFPENGGLPDIGFGGYIDGIGSPQYMPSDERENTFQFLDNVTKVRGNHTIKFGINFQHLRFYGLQPPNSLGSQNYSGQFTGDPYLGQSEITGSGVADFLLDMMNSSSLTSFSQFTDRRWYDAAFVQDDWKITPRLTLNLGVRYEYAQPNAERNGYQANFIGNYSGFNAGSGVFLMPYKAISFPVPPALQTAFADDHIQVQYTSNPFLVNPDKTDFAPRVGFAYRLNDKTVVRGGFGIFYGGLENLGLGPNLGSNEPFNVSAGFNPPAPPESDWGSCQNVATLSPSIFCPTNGQTLETGFSTALNAPGGLQSVASLATIFAQNYNQKSPYSEAYNLTVERAINSSTSFHVGYVGNTDRHLQSSYNANNYPGIVPFGFNGQLLQPFFDFGTIEPIVTEGMSDYNSLQATIQHQASGGLTYLANYTWAHCLDDAFATIGQARYGGYRNPNLLGFNYDYGPCVQDVRQRFTFTGTYELPFGRGKRFLDTAGSMDKVVGGWKGSLVFVAQSGLPVFLNATRGGGYPFQIASAFASGGTAATDGTQNGFTCAAKTRTIQSWYNPCSFANPPLAYAQPGWPTGPCPTGPAPQPAPGYTNTVWVCNGGLTPYGPRGRVSVEGPGYNTINMSLFKNFAIPFRESQLQFRTDIFNLLNHPTFAIPNNGLSGSNASEITNTLFSGETPDARVVQFALKYSF
jgi:Carboxypeptidase regulatory-like domain